MLRSIILTAARSQRVGRLVEASSTVQSLARRFVAGHGSDEAVLVTRDLVAGGLAVSLCPLDGDTAAVMARDGYLRLLAALADAELTPAAEVSVRLRALGLADDPGAAFGHAHAICARASEAGTTVTLDAEDHTATDAVLEALGRLRLDFPTTGVTVQAYLRRTEADCRELATAGSRVRLCKGGYPAPESIAYQSGPDVDRSYVRCLNALLAGEGYPMVATHDARLVAITEDRARWFDRSPDEFEFQMRYGVRGADQRRLAAEGYTVRVYLPYGRRWYGYLAGRVAERPVNLGLLVRQPRDRS